MTWWNTVQTSKGAAGVPAGAAAFKRRLRRWGARAAGRRESGFVVREIGYFLDILGMTNPVVGIEDKNRPALDSQVLDQSSIIGAERRIFVVGEHFHLIHAEGQGPKLGREQPRWRQASVRPQRPPALLGNGVIAVWQIPAETNTPDVHR